MWNTGRPGKGEAFYHGDVQTIYPNIQSKEKEGAEQMDIHRIDGGGEREGSGREGVNTIQRYGRMGTEIQDHHNNAQGDQKEMREILQSIGWDMIYITAWKMEEENEGEEEEGSDNGRERG